MKSSFRDLLTHYPSGAKVLSSLAGKVFGIEAERVAVGNGAAELIDAVARLLPGLVAVPIPSFNEYPARFGDSRTRVVPTGEAGFSYCVESLEAAMEGADTLVLVNPDNPSGHFLGVDETRSLIDALLAKGKRVIVDESFADFAEPRERFTLIDDSYLSERPGLVVIKSISKSYGVPGIRLGILASGDSELISTIQKLLPVWNINSLGEFFLQIVDKYKAEYRSACDRLAAERARFATRLAGLGMLHVYPSQANYLMCRLDRGLRARSLAEHLLIDKRILIKDLTGKQGFPEGQYVRLAIRTPEENDRLVEAISRM